MQAACILGKRHSRVNRRDRGRLHFPKRPITLQLLTETITPAARSFRISEVGYASAYRGPAATKRADAGSLAVSGRACPPFIVDCSLSSGNVANAATDLITRRYILSRHNFEDVASMIKTNGLARRSRNQELLAGGLARRLSLPTRYLWVTKQTLQPVVSQGLRLRASQHR